MGQSQKTLKIFFAGRNVFITGATGYLGGVLLFKLLSYCPDIGKLYLLIRSKRGKSPKERPADIKEQFFIKNIERKGQLDKLVLVRGDTQEIGKRATPPI